MTKYRTCRDCTIVASDVAYRVCDYWLCDDCFEERLANPPAPGVNVARQPNWKKNMIKTNKLEQAGKQSSNGTEMNLREASHVVFLTHEKSVNAMNLQKLSKFDVDATRQIVQAALTDVLPPNSDATSIANESAKIASKLKELVDSRFTSLSAETSFSPRSFADKILAAAASPLKPTGTSSVRTAQSSAVTASPKVACLDNCSLNHQVKGKPIECSLCSREFHTQCVGLNASGKRPVWFCHSCKSMPITVKQLQRDNDLLKRENATLQDSIKHLSEQLKRETNVLQEALKNQADVIAELAVQPSMDTKTKSPESLIIGDSIIKGINPNGLVNTDVECLTGGTIAKIKDHLHDKKDIQNLQTMIIHVGTNDCTTDNDVDDAVKSYGDMLESITKKAPGVEIFISTVCPRADEDGKHQGRVDKLNSNLKTLGHNHGCKIIDNDRNFKLSNQEPDEGSLNGSKLHLNDHGTRKLLNNFHKAHPIIKKRDTAKTNDAERQHKIQRRHEMDEFNDHGQQGQRPRQGQQPRQGQRHEQRQQRQNQRRYTTPDSSAHHYRQSNRFGNHGNRPAYGRGCYYCGEQNHQKKNCRHGKPVLCYSCGQLGHKQHMNLCF